MKPTRGYKLARMPLDLGHDAARLAPALRLIAEAGVVAAHLVRRSPDRALEQVSDPVLQDAVGRQPDRVADALGFEELVDLGIGEGRVAAKIEPLHGAPVAGDHRLQHRAPAIGAVHVARPQSAPLQIAELVEHEQRVIAGAAKMAVVGAAFLLAVGRALARIHVEHDRSSAVAAGAPCRSTGRADRRARQGSPAGSATSVSNRPIWLAEAADPVIARSPTTQRIAGSRHSRSASFTSS